MDIDEKMIKAFSNRVKKEYEEFVYEGINVSKIRSMVGGYSSIDLAPNIQVRKEKNVYIYSKGQTNRVIFSIHGGGFYAGEVTSIQNCNKYIANNTNIDVISIDYTLAPTKQYPYIMYEIYDTIRENIEKYGYTTVYISGDSAGAMLALDVVLLNPNIFSYVFMYYPVIQIEKRANWSIKEYNLKEPCTYAKASIMQLKYSIDTMKKLYLPKEYDKDSMYINLLNIKKEDFIKLPKILVVKAEYDYFNLDIDDFCNKFNIECIEYKGMGHGFLEILGYVDSAKEVLDETIKRIK